MRSSPRKWWKDWNRGSLASAATSRIHDCIHPSIHPSESEYFKLRLSASRPQSHRLYRERLLDMDRKRAQARFILLTAPYVQHELKQYFFLLKLKIFLNGQYQNDFDWSFKIRLYGGLPTAWYAGKSVLAQNGHI